eukprot:CAMPEP_0113934704 /NCGR_PEP_ID=MMETSP1339-20121228/1977_1 /TAXON_ID=94617 /ORGANISM="Fibrocapsa japonica" /LENGTH=66 /DNA_ID=CAMNT_0000936607 /DNA_START=384 /DNA_END=584 /DNA_ORIENTATION=- /assembly_acc=CAM_ASM_000762
MGANTPQPIIWVAALKATACDACIPLRVSTGRNTIPPAMGAPPLGRDAATIPIIGVYHSDAISAGV